MRTFEVTLHLERLTLLVEMSDEGLAEVEDADDLWDAVQHRLEWHGIAPDMLARVKWQIHDIDEVIEEME